MVSTGQADYGDFSDERGRSGYAPLKTIGDNLASPFLDLLRVTADAISVYDHKHQALVLHANDPTSARLEKMQFDLGEGPMLSSFTAAPHVLIPDPHVSAGGCRRCQEPSRKRHRLLSGTDAGVGYDQHGDER